MHYQRALLTGASSGIGRGLALALAAQGTTVVLAARREDELRNLAVEIEREGGHARILPLDVTDTEGTIRAIREMDDALGGLDLVVANAGVGASSRKAAELSAADIARQCDCNLRGAIATLVAALPAMTERKRGHVAAVSSIAAMSPLPRSAVYCATKAGLTMFMESLRLELAGTGVNCTVIHPGFIKTPLTENAKHPMPFLMECDEAVKHILERLPLAPNSIDFPVPLVAAARFNAALPPGLRKLVTGRAMGRGK